MLLGVRCGLEMYYNEGAEIERLCMNGYKGQQAMYKNDCMGRFGIARSSKAYMASKPISTVCKRYLLNMGYISLDERLQRWGPHQGWNIKCIDRLVARANAHY